MTQIKIIFSIFGNLIDVDVISNILKLTPTSFWQKGDIIPDLKKRLVRKESCWEYSIGFIQTYHFEDVSEKFMELIKPHIQLIENYIKENNLQTKIDVVVEIVNEETPSLSIGMELMELIVRLNGSIEIDLYVFEE